MDPIALIVVAIVCGAIGFIVSQIIGGGRKDKSKTGTGEDHKNDKSAAGQEVEVARLFRAEPGGPLWVETDGEVWETSSQVGEAQRTNLENILIEFEHWLSPDVVHAFESAHLPVEAAAGGSPAFSFDPSLPDQSNKGGASKSPFVKDKTIVEQIDEILQELVMKSPFSSRKIRIVEIPNQGVAVQVDRDVYPGIDSVTDPEIRNLIRQAVSKWETRAS